jgi:hypothetical protein
MTISESNSEGTPIFESTRQTYDELDSTGSGMQPDGVRGEAGRLADSAVDAGKDVAGVAKDEALNVVEETKVQAQDLLRQTQDELREQAALQQKRVAAGLHSIGEELDQMAGASETHGVASDLVGQAARRTRSVASWLDERDPGSLLQEVKSYARRSPGTFIAIAAAAGALGGRLTRALASDGGTDHTGSTSGGPL